MATAHGDAHGDAHGTGTGHSHGMSADADRRYLWIALVLLVAFAALEVVVAFTADSLALLSDAGHMLSGTSAPSWERCGR